MRDDQLTASVDRLWREHFGDTEGLELTPCATSGNNRVYIARAGRRKAVAKCYFAAPEETRDRLDAEWRFLLFAAEAGIDNAPRALTRDDAAHVALHSCLEGDRASPAAIDDGAVNAAANFLRALDSARHLPSASALPAAAEAAFSATAHFAVIERRLAALGRIERQSPIDADAQALATRMARHWGEMKLRLIEGLARLGLSATEELPAAERIVSPSDFGFHNALIGSGGAVSFFDFEYAGWDDPAKTLNDFFLQPAVPVPPRYRAGFVAQVLSGRPAAERMAARADLLRPMFALKWCCIMLNPFVPHRARRGRFADPAGDEAERKSRQLAKATDAFHNICES